MKDRGRSRSRSPPSSRSSSSSSSSDSSSSDHSDHEDRHRDKRRKKDKEAKRSSQKKSKKAKKSKKSKKSKKAKSSKDFKKQQVPPERQGPHRDPGTFEKISEDDYFNMNNEFRQWLLNGRDVYFGELEAEKARKYFAKFVGIWNQGVLIDAYYDRKFTTAGDLSDRTRFKWSFAASLEDKPSVLSPQGFTNDKIKEPSTKKVEKVIGPTMPSAPEKSFVEKLDDEREHREALRNAQRAEFKRKQRDYEEVMEELAPKATGREAMIEKKRAMNASRRRSPSPDAEIGDADLMGGGGSFQAALQEQQRYQQKRESRREEKREEKASIKSEKLKQHMAKESQTLAMFAELAKHHKLGPPGGN